MRGWTIGMMGMVAACAGGCSHTVQIGKLGTSSVKYAADGPPLSLSLEDTRPPKPGFSHGAVTVHVEFAHGDEMAFLNAQLSKELRQRGVKTGGAGQSVVRGVVRTFQIRNRRVTGFSPMVTYVAFAADFTDGTRTERIVVYSKNAKVPVWSMGEVDEPCYTQPLKNLAAEIVAKIEGTFGSRSASDAQVAEMAAAARGGDARLALAAIYDLGSSNNAAAIPSLVELSGHDAETYRAAALSGLGILRAHDRMPLLVETWKHGKATSDRYMALKAIGDLGTPQALAFLKQARAAEDEEDISELVDLYLAERPAATVASVASATAATTTTPAATPPAIPSPAAPSPAPTAAQPTDPAAVPGAVRPPQG